MLIHDHKGNLFDLILWNKQCVWQGMQFSFNNELQFVKELLDPQIPILCVSSSKCSQEEKQKDTIQPHLQILQMSSDLPFLSLKTQAPGLAFNWKQPCKGKKQHAVLAENQDYFCCGFLAVYSLTIFPYQPFQICMYLLINQLIKTSLNFKTQIRTGKVLPVPVKFPISK